MAALAAEVTALAEDISKERVEALLKKYHATTVEAALLEASILVADDEGMQDIHDLVAIVKDINCVDKHGNTALHNAIKFCFEKPNNPRAFKKNFSTQHATIKLQAITFLIMKGANPFKKNNAQHTAFDLSDDIKKSYQRLYEVAIKSSANIEEILGDQTDFFCAI